MNRLVFVSLLALSSAASAQTAPTPAAPAAAAAPAVGATVTGKDNQPAGVIAQITAQAVVIDTGTNKVPVPPASIGSSPKGPTIQMTKAELDAAYAQAAQQAQANIQLTPGTMVHGLNDVMLGTIKTADAEFVTVTTPKGEVKLPRTGFAPGPDNSVRVGVTAAQLDAAISGAAATPPPAATASDGTAATETAPPDASATPQPAKTPKTAKPKR